LIQLYDKEYLIIYSLSKFFFFVIRALLCFKNDLTFLFISHLGEM